ncbi:hypothetical protein [Microbulbifer sp. TRSA005]|uniref:hypothetical protein n=1 Tax=Microbulbifer sp. TRSA005 TaxID=3243383 RepID=UPI004039A935
MEISRSEPIKKSWLNCGVTLALQVGQVVRRVKTVNISLAKLDGVLGVWKRAGGKRRPTVKPTLIFLKGKPDYRKRFPFLRIAEGIARRHLPIELDKAMDHAIATAKRR